MQAVIWEYSWLAGCNMGRKKQGKFVRPDNNKGKDKRHKMKGKSLEAFTEEMHTAFEGKNELQSCVYTVAEMVGVIWVLVPHLSLF